MVGVKGVFNPWLFSSLWLKTSRWNYLPLLREGRLSVDPGSSYCLCIHHALIEDIWAVGKPQSENICRLNIKDTVIKQLFSGFSLSFLWLFRRSCFSWSNLRDDQSFCVCVCVLLFSYSSLHTIFTYLVKTSRPYGNQSLVLLLLNSLFKVRG